MPNIYDIKHVVAYENGKEATCKEIIEKSQGEKYIEVLIPFSDPIAESPDLQDASVRAMNHAHTTDDIFDLLNDLQNKIKSKIILSLYLNTAFAYGYEDFCRRAKEAGVFGLNVKDMPFKERDEIQRYTNSSQLHVVHTLASKELSVIDEILSSSTELVYLSNSLTNKLCRDQGPKLTEYIKGKYGLDILCEESN